MEVNNQYKITVLGTGTSFGVPVIGCDCKVCSSVDPKDKRFRTALKIESNEATIVIDTGPDFRQQMLNSRTKRLDAILFTHEHKDHIAGLDDVRAFNWLMQKPMQVYAEPRVQEAIKRELPYVFEATSYPGIPKLELNTIDEKVIQINDLSILPIRAYHYKLPVYGFRINEFAYLTDLKTLPDESMKKLKGVKYLIIEALMHKPHISHLNVEEALAIINEIKPEKAWFTHINHNLGLHQELVETLPGNVEPAYDGMKIVV